MKTTFFLALSLLVPVVSRADIRSGDLLLAHGYQVEKGEVDLSSADRTVFAEGSVVRGTLGKSVLKNANLINLDLAGIDFGQADVTGSNFAWTNLAGVRFNKAKVKGAHFENTFGLTDGQKEGLKKRGASVSEKDPIAKPGALIESLMSRDTQSALDLIGKDFELEQVDQYGNTPLLLASENGDDVVVQALLSKNVLVDSSANDELTPLIGAAKEGHEKVVALLLSAKADPERKDHLGYNPLLWSIENKHEKVASLLIDNMPDLSGCADEAIKLAEERELTEIAQKLKNRINDTAVQPSQEPEDQEEKNQETLSTQDAQEVKVEIVGTTEPAVEAQPTDHANQQNEQEEVKADQAEHVAQEPEVTQTTPVSEGQKTKSVVEEAQEAKTEPTVTEKQEPVVEAQPLVEHEDSKNDQQEVQVKEEKREAIQPEAAQVTSAVQAQETEPVVEAKPAAQEPEANTAKKGKKPAPTKTKKASKKDEL